MYSHIRNLSFAFLLSLCLSTSAYAAHENAQLPVIIKSPAALVSNQSSRNNPYADELWLIGSFVFSATGLFIILHYLHRQ